MSTPRKLGIITNYKDNILNGGNIKNPIEIELARWFGITNSSSEPIQKNLKGNQDNLLMQQTPEQFLNTYFKGKFETFNKLSIDSKPNKRDLDYPWSLNFDASNLIVHLEVNKDGNNWNTVKNSDGSNNNRIYLFDQNGKEVRTKNDTESAFYEIIIKDNNLTLTKDGVKVTFVLTGIAMTLAKLINKLLGTDIKYNNDSVPAQQRKLTGESRVSDATAAAAAAAVPSAEPSAEPSAQPFQPSSNLPPPPPPRPLTREEEKDDDSDYDGPASYGGKGKKSRKKQRNGVKKSRKQSKGDKKSRKQRKSLRKNKRSRSKK